MIVTNNIKMAIASLRTFKWRSFLTMLGVIVGVVSVVTTVSIGEGVKRQVSGQINELGSDLITVLPGRAVSRDSDGNISKVNIFNLFGATGALSEQDWKTIRQTEGVEVAVPMGLITGIPNTGEREYEQGLVIATTESIAEVLKDKVQFGDLFTEKDQNQHTAVIGKKVARQLFQENVPVGESFKLRDQNFIVRGVLEEFETSPFSLSTDFNSAIIIQYNVGKKLSDNQTQIYQVLVKPEDPNKTEETIQAMNTNLLNNRGGQKDFTILRQEENLALANTVLTLLTALIAGVAAISLLVGGIGIMNIMLVSVTERTHEIGIRKAIGATNGQIYSQFVIEAAVLSFIGGVIGVLASILANYLLRIFTNLQPVITWPIVLIAAGVAMAVGVFFGVTPALRAAQKNPIDALRHE